MARESLKYWFHLINSRYFRNTLPRDCVVQWSSQLDDKVLGDFKPGLYISRQRVRGTDKGSYRRVYERKPRIRINNSLAAIGNCIAIMTLIHECAHLKLYLRGSKHYHGPDFQREMKRIANQGGFQGLW